jgi:hypothetical protein
MVFFGEALAKNPPTCDVKASDFVVPFGTNLCEIQGYSP